MTLYDTFRRYIGEEIPVTLATVVSGPSDVGAKLLVQADSRTEGEVTSGALQVRLVADAVRLLMEGRPETVPYQLPSGTYEVFFDVFPALPQLIIVGATHAASPLTVLAKSLGYRVVVTDARAAFLSEGRFPAADRIIKGWPQDVLPGLRMDGSTYLVLLSHDPKFDEPTLDYALRMPVRYIGAIGSRKTQKLRMERLRADGFDEDALSRVYGPVGLDLGGRSAEETALAIMAEITAVRYGADGGSLRRQLMQQVPA